MLDGDSEIVLANMLNEKRLICTYDQGLAKPLPTSPYVLVDRRLLCHCHIQSGLTYVLKTIGSCNSTDQPVLYYTVNLAFLNYFSNFLNGSDNIPSNPMEDETVLPIAMEDFSKDPAFPLLSGLLYVSNLFGLAGTCSLPKEIIPPNLQETLQRMSL